MPYSMALYPNESCPVPEVGDIFVVEEVDENVTDYHWGKGVYVKLRPVTEGEEDESEDAILVSSGILERLKARAMKQSPSTDWESELDAM